ncbi:Hypothetical predicted protein [Octopus vulgaris]|uniref:Uncharacterized protein n=1 Tax=Octopus vulgaris TaxID=6645 RepID=A0AA36AQ86_OCTVU|nr:Hypothetical predicted protein [Octopus vulgaris]
MTEMKIRVVKEGEKDTARIAGFANEIHLADYQFKVISFQVELLYCRHDSFNSEINLSQTFFTDCLYENEANETGRHRDWQTVIKPTTNHYWRRPKAPAIVVLVVVIVAETAGVTVAVVVVVLVSVFGY